MFSLFFFFFFFNDTATTEIYTLSLHDALPISTGRAGLPHRRCGAVSGRETRCQTSGVHSASGTPESAAALPANPPDAAPTREPPHVAGPCAPVDPKAAAAALGRRSFPLSRNGLRQGHEARVRSPVFQE